MCMSSKHSYIVHIKSYWWESKKHTHMETLDGEIHRRKCWVMLSNWWFCLLLCVWTYLDLVYTNIKVYISTPPSNISNRIGWEIIFHLNSSLFFDSHLIFPFFCVLSSKKTSILSRGVVFSLFVWVKNENSIGKASSRCYQFCPIF